MVEMSSPGGSWKKVGYTASRETQFTIAGLHEGENYFFRVAAENSLGLSKPLQSDVVTPTRPVGMYGFSMFGLKSKPIVTFYSMF